VIAVARAKTFTVISGENATRKLEAPRIPDVCDDLGIRWIRMLDFFREQKVVLGVLTVIGWIVFLSASLIVGFKCDSSIQASIRSGPVTLFSVQEERLFYPQCTMPCNSLCHCSLLLRLGVHRSPSSRSMYCYQPAYKKSIISFL